MTSEPVDAGSLARAPLDQVEDAVRDALSRGNDAGLRVLGYGEISLVLGWPVEEPVWACKRLPEFETTAAAGTYGERFDLYLSVLRNRGVEPVPSIFRTVAGPAGGVIGYVVQPVLPSEWLGPNVLRSADPDPGHPLIRGIRDVVPRVVDEHTGFDAQVSNWTFGGPGADASLQYLDVSTPMLFDDRGHIELDLGLFLAAYPWLLRRPIRRFVAPGVIGAYRDARHVLLDMTANLLKERLTAWVPVVVAAANEVIAPAITEEEVRKYYRSDARLWELMLRLRRWDRRWQGTVRHRTYPFLLPGPIRR